MSFCISCHSINDKGGTGTIDLGRVGSKLTRARLLGVVAATHEVDPRTAMPQYHFDRGQVADVVAYLGDELSDASFLADDADSALARLGNVLAFGFGAGRHGTPPVQGAALRQLPRVPGRRELDSRQPQSVAPRREEAHGDLVGRDEVPAHAR